ncbi:hypothetical protein HDK77DRAFT_297230 [Phyllosticta capitalensis]
MRGSPWCLSLFVRWRETVQDETKSQKGAASRRVTTRLLRCGQSTGVNGRRLRWTNTQDDDDDNSGGQMRGTKMGAFLCNSSHPLNHSTHQQGWTEQTGPAARKADKKRGGKARRQRRRRGRRHMHRGNTPPSSMHQELEDSPVSMRFETVPRSHGVGNFFHHSLREGGLRRQVQGKLSNHSLGLRGSTNASLFLLFPSPLFLESFFRFRAFGYLQMVM